MKSKEDLILVSPLTWAYIGDAVYELYIREYLISKNICKVNDLQNESLNYVSAKSQSFHLGRLIDNNFLTQEEIEMEQAMQQNEDVIVEE